MFFVNIIDTNYKFSLFAKLESIRNKNEIKTNSFHPYDSTTTYIHSTCFIILFLFPNSPFCDYYTIGGYCTVQFECLKEMNKILV